MTHDVSSTVTIVGGGPVGLCLAMDLASRGVDVVVLELRAAGELPSVKCNHVASRTMETFRRLGFVAEVRAAGLPIVHYRCVALLSRYDRLDAMAAISLLVFLHVQAQYLRRTIHEHLHH